MPPPDDWYLAQTMRKVTNLIRYGTVVQADPANARVKVKIAEGLVTDWVPMPAVRAGGDRTWWPLENGEQVIVGMVNGDPAQAAILSVANQDAHPAPFSGADVSGTRYSDGATITYDRAAHVYEATLPTAGEFRFTVGNTRLVLKNGQAELTVGGATLILEAGQLTIAVPQTEIDGRARATGTITSDTDVIAVDKHLKTHLHSGVLSGPANTGPPVGGT